MRVPHRISSSPCNLQYKRRAITLKKSSLVNFVTGRSPRATVRDFALSLPCSSSANAMLGMGVYFHNLMTFLRVHYLHVNYWFEQPIPHYSVHTLARASNGSCTRFRQRSLPVIPSFTRQRLCVTTKRVPSQFSSPPHLDGFNYFLIVRPSSASFRASLHTTNHIHRRLLIRVGVGRPSYLTTFVSAFHPPPRLRN